MKIYNAIKILAAALLLSLATAACTGKENNEEYKVQQVISDALIHVNDISTGATTEYKGAGYNIIYDYIAATADITLTGLSTPSGTKYPTIKLTKVPFKVDNAGWRIIDGTNVQSSIEGFASAPLFNKFRLDILDRVIGQYYYPVININFTFDSNYSVVSTNMGQVFLGTTETSTNGQVQFTNNESTYVLELNPEKLTADLTIDGIKFVQAMPAMTMTFPNIPYSISNQGVITLDAESIIPTIDKVPYENYPISDFHAEYVLSTGMNLNFVCTVKGAPFSVSATLPFISKTNGN